MGFKREPTAPPMIAAPKGAKIYRLKQSIVQTSVLIVVAESPEEAKGWAQRAEDGGPQVLYVQREVPRYETTECTELGDVET